MEEDTNATQEANVEKQEEQSEEDYKSKYMYLLAEVDNYKKSKEKELVEYIKYSNERLIIDLLKVLDDFESVLKQENDEKVQALYKALLSVLSHYGLEKMDVVGKDFSSDIAEAVATEESNKEKGKIIEEVQKGYKLNGKIIRYPKVKISI
ncbi:MAG: nucleotide exchange factor GrpE [Candidatus Parvarchaeum sp.]